MSAKVHLERQKKAELRAGASSAPAFAPRVPTVTLISHRELRDKHTATRLQPESPDLNLATSSYYRYSEGSRVQKVGTMPDSPADVKTQPRSTPPTMPPPPPAVSQATNRNASFTPATSKSMLNGSSHSPTSLNGAPSTPNGFSNGPAMSSTASLSNQQLPPACGARQLCKLKRFLTTLQQFGNDISPEIGERVRSLVLGLVNSTLTIEEFHSKLHEATNFPLRPFVIPFLKANLPLLQRELLHCARLAKQTPAQYLAQHEQLLLDANASSPLDSSEIMLEMNEHGKRRTPDRTKDSSERDGLHPEHMAKRPCTISPSQRFSPSTGLPAHPPPNGLPTHPPNGLPHPPNPQMGPQHYRLEDMALAHQYRDAYRHNEHRDARDRHRQTVHGARQEEVIDHRLTDREWAEEWKHLDNLLNCIMDMVEKTRRSLTVLRRCQEADREEMNHWIRRYSDVEEMKKGGSNGQHCLPPPPLPPPTPHHNSSSNTASSSESLPIGTSSAAERQTGRQTEIHRDFLHRPPSGYLPEEIWRKAGTTSIPLSPALKHLQNRQEEAVNEVKRQAMSELQKAVSDAERKAHEMISAERSKMERALAEAKRQASEDALTVINQQEDSSESCWNCGRKASETCSGCNTARYCGSFCQHKDWEKHHHVCGQGLQGLPGGSSVPLGTPSSSSASSGAPPTHSESTPPGALSLAGQSSIAGGPGSGSGSVSASPKESSSSSASRSTTPATPALLDATSR
ncbi:protein CBFA2T3 isoform X2 [Anoplopoma fimbria]|uniref:protein CBFA2T3 isoform X2 n=1 Tax=Anoplopoma fimbria TaxID=229290 RepID=UPI0023EBAF9B|nr:protein CBFA2T3 isoform X2 [Anoplopoma fimbria]